MGIENEKTYDAVFWAGVINMKKYIIPLVNEAFGEHFTENATVDPDPNKQVFEHTDGSFGQGEMDALVTLNEASVSKKYHFEVETWVDNSIVVRIAEYSIGVARDNLQLTERGLEATLPNSAVIFLKKAKTIPDKLLMIVKGCGGELINEIPVIKLENYSIDDLFEKKLFLLIPFYGFHFDEEFEKMDATGIEELKEDLDEISDRLVKMVESGEMSADQHGHLIDWMGRVLDKLTYRYENLREGVDAIMRTYILRTRTDEILDQGRAEGRDKRDREKIEEMLRKGKTPEAIADFCGYPIELVKSVQESMKAQEAQEENMTIAN